MLRSENFKFMGHADFAVEARVHIIVQCASYFLRSIFQLRLFHESQSKLPVGPERRQDESHLVNSMNDKHLIAYD